jgi:hypothetical protein
MAEYIASAKVISALAGCLDRFRGQPPDVTSRGV